MSILLAVVLSFMSMVLGISIYHFNQLTIKHEAQLRKMNFAIQSIEEAFNWKLSGEHPDIRVAELTINGRQIIVPVREISKANITWQEEPVTKAVAPSFLGMKK